jgi:hypothetical protein
MERSYNSLYHHNELRFRKYRTYRKSRMFKTWESSMVDAGKNGWMGWKLISPAFTSIKEDPQSSQESLLYSKRA